MQHLFLLLLLFVFMACNNSNNANNAETLEVPAAADATLAPELFSSLSGRWQSVDDAKNVIEIQGNQFISYYDGNEVSKEALQVFEQCEGPCANGQDLNSMACFMTKSDIDSTCYALVELDERNLSYALIGGRGNTLRFTRVKN